MRRDGDNIGAITMSGPSRLAAHELFTAELAVTLALPLRQGGRLVLAMRHWADSHPQMDDPSAENYVSVRASRPGIEWRLGDRDDWGRHPWNCGIDLTLVSGSLAPGDDVTVTLGDRAAGSPGYRAIGYTDSWRFLVGVDPDGNGAWKVASFYDAPRIEVVGGRLSRIAFFVSDVTGSGGRRVCRLKPEDAHGNVASDVPRTPLAILDCRSRPIGSVVLQPGRASTVEVAPGDPDAWQRLAAASADGALFAFSNPAGKSPVDGRRLYWGEIHAQSMLCDGTKTPAGQYEFARDAAGLDFASVTSHDFEMTGRDWGEVLYATRAAHEPGRFVTFPGYEWSGRNPAGGDHNIYFLDDDAPMVHSTPFGGYPRWDPAECEVTESITIAETIRRLRGRRFMVVPHFGGRPANLDYFDPSVMPLVEIHSCHRGYEMVAREALSRGLRFGFTGGSDDHRGAIGDSHPLPRSRYFSSHSGLVGVWARELTRESLWRAFFERRTFATSGPRIALHVTASAEDASAPMGGEIAAGAGAEVALSVWACMDGFLDRIEIFAGGDPVLTFQERPGVNQIPEIRMDFRLPGRPGVTAYYVKVIQTDGGAAWSSPVWVAPRT